VDLGRDAGADRCSRCSRRSTRSAWCRPRITRR
jgi:hypothetical protein